MSCKKNLKYFESVFEYEKPYNNRVAFFMPSFCAKKGEI